MARERAKARDKGEEALGSEALRERGRITVGERQRARLGEGQRGREGERERGREGERERGREGERWGRQGVMGAAQSEGACLTAGGGSTGDW